MYKVGDLVRVFDYSGSLKPQFAAVTRVTKTQVTLDNGKRFNIKHRREIGDRRGQLITPERQECNELAQFLKSFNWFGCDLNTLRKVRKLAGG